ncbi:MAG: DNA primase [Acholeplasmatales bacterium]|jgi:DNA primase|nr:DNA primase [Acholeplasmatales bacterium]
MAENNNNVLALLNEKLSILDMVREFISVQKSGRGYVACCPFHEEKTPSFSVSIEKNMFNCFGCHKGGGPVQFYQYMKAITIGQAISELSPRIGIKAPTSYAGHSKFYKMFEYIKEYMAYQLNSSSLGAPGRQYLASRQIDENIINSYKLGFNSNDEKIIDYLREKNFSNQDLLESGVFINKDKPTFLFKNRLIFPIFDRNNSVVSFSSRSIDKSVKEAKYVHAQQNSINTDDKLFYNLNLALSSIIRLKQVILVEGFFDVFAFVRAGITNVLCCLGTQISQRHLKVLKGITDKVVLCFDGDQAGTTSMIKAFSLFLNAKMEVSIASLPGQMDPDEYLEKNGAAALAQVLENPQDPYLFAYNYYASQTDSLSQNSLINLENQLNELFNKTPKPIFEHYQDLAFRNYGFHLQASNSTLPDKTFEDSPPVDYDFLSSYQTYEEALYEPRVDELEPIEPPSLIMQNLSTKNKSEQNLNDIKKKIRGLEINALALCLLNPDIYENVADYFERGDPLDIIYTNLKPHLSGGDNLETRIKHLDMRLGVSIDIVQDIEKKVYHTSYDKLQNDLEKQKALGPLYMRKKFLLEDLKNKEEEKQKKAINDELRAVSLKIKKLEKGEKNGTGKI